MFFVRLAGKHAPGRGPGRGHHCTQQTVVPWTMVRLGFVVGTRPKKKVAASHAALAEVQPQKRQRMKALDRMPNSGYNAGYLARRAGG
jgi:hypothetical protein